MPSTMTFYTKTPYHAACLSKDDFNRAACNPLEFLRHRQKSFHKIVHIMETRECFAVYLFIVIMRTFFPAAGNHFSGISFNKLIHQKLNDGAWYPQY